MVLAIEPMINAGTGDIELLDDGWTVVTADGRDSAHFEHTVVVLRDRHGNPHPFPLDSRVHAQGIPLVPDRAQ